MYERFEQLCQKHGVTPYKVSKETGVSQTTLSSWKTRNSTPNLETAMKIAKYFGVPVGYLIEDENTTKNVEDLAVSEDKTFMYSRAEALHGIIAEATRMTERKFINMLYAFAMADFTNEQMDLLIDYCEKLNEDQRWFVNAVIGRELQK